MRKLKEDYLIRIRSSVEQGGPPETVELATKGSFVRKNGSFFITYRETEATGYAGCTTTLKVAEDGSRVAMLRFGPTPSQLIIEKGTRHLCHYETGYGSITLGVAADEIVQELGPEGGHARFSYVLDSGNEELISRNLVQVTVTPVR